MTANMKKKLHFTNLKTLKSLLIKTQYIYTSCYF